MIEKFCLPDPPPGLRSRILERAAISPTPASATGSAWKVVSIAGAIAVFLAIGALIVLPLRRTSSSGESGTSAKRWLAPWEVLRRSDDMPLPFSRRIFRSPGGKAGLVSYGWNHGPKILLARDHTLPWSELSFVGQDPSEPLLDGEAVSFLFKRGDSIEFLRVDLTRKEASGPTSLPGIADGKWANLQCLALGDELFALVRVPDGRVMFSKSPDKGATWSPLGESPRRARATSAGRLDSSSSGKCCTSFT